MSFSDKIKKELVKQKIHSKIEALIELTSLLKTNASISIRNAFFNINFTTENQEVSKRIYRLINYVYDYEAVVSFVKNDSINKEGIFMISVEEEKVVESMLADTGIDYLGNYVVNESVLLNRLEDEKGFKKVAFLRGAFLGTGSMVDPKKSYHLEMIFSKEEDYLLVKKILADLEIKVLNNVRKGKYVIYIKDSNNISDFLTTLSAVNSMLYLENVKVEKDLRNKVNRLVNCDTANINKSIDAATRLIDQINYIEEKVGLQILDPKVMEAAKLRRAHPELSIKDLAKMSDPPVSKSGFNHRLLKISEEYENLKKI